jgi:8-oxo-dGTP pyrophosphatase MutT (NUDIX family)
MLAIKRADNGEWVLPGGIVELDEDPRDTSPLKSPAPEPGRRAPRGPRAERRP